MEYDSAYYHPESPVLTTAWNDRHSTECAMSPPPFIPMMIPNHDYGWTEKIRCPPFIPVPRTFSRYYDVDDCHFHHHYQRTHDTTEEVVEEMLLLFEAKKELDADPLSLNMDCPDPSKFFE
jgi:hypothetical protein